MNYIKSKRIYFSIVAISILSLIACINGNNSENESEPNASNDHVLSSSNLENAQISKKELLSEDNESSYSKENDFQDAQKILEAQELILSKIYSDTKNSVVSIRTTEKLVDYWSLQQFDRELGQGSGFVWDQFGHIVTNNHVIEGASRIIVVMSDGKEFSAEIVGSDIHSDLAVIRIIDADDLIELEPITIGSSNEVVPGHMTVALGNPFAQRNTMTTGIVSAVGRTFQAKDSPYSITEVIQTDAAINPGNSGGPLLNNKGEAIGVNYMIYSSGGSNVGIGFAIPIDIAKRVVPSLIEIGVYEYSYLGVGVGNITNEIELKMKEVLPRENLSGAVLSFIYPNTPAEDAGFVAGDVVLNINKIDIRNADDLLVFLNTKTSPGDVIEVEIFSEGEVIQRSVTLGVRPS